MPVTTYSFIVPVWGQLFADTFMHYSFASLLAQTHVIDSPDIELIISTDHETADYMRWNYFDKLCSLNCVFVLTDVFYDIPPHQMQTHLYRLGLRYISKKQTDPARFAIFITPDIILPATALEAIIRKVSEGFMCCYMLGLRLLDTAESRKHIDSLIVGDVLSLSPWQLIELAYKFMHPQTEWLTTNYYWAKRPRNFYPHLYLKTDQQFQAKGFHLHPLFLRVPKGLPQIKDTIDGDFIGRLGFSKDQIGFFDDSFPVVSVDLAPEDRFSHNVLYKSPISPASVFEFSLKQTSFQRRLFGHVFHFSSDTRRVDDSRNTQDEDFGILSLDRYGVRATLPALYLARIYTTSCNLSIAIFRKILPGRISLFIINFLKTWRLNTSKLDYTVLRVGRDAIQ